MRLSATPATTASALAAPPANAFGRGLVLVGTTSAISATSGLLYDEADSGTDPNAF